jgi:hypothetical protein
MRRSGALAAVVAVVLTTSGCGSSGAAPAPSDEPEPLSGAEASAKNQGKDPVEVPVTPARRADSVARPQPPRVAVLPSGRSVPIEAAGTTPAGLLDVPSDIDTAGWWTGGARLGDPFGSVLVAAHVDSTTQGLGPFAELLTVRAGTRVLLESAGLRQAFEVTSRRLVPQGSLVDDSWIFDASGELRLTLVTCAPPYVAAAGGYQNLAVVTAVPLGPPEET